MKRILEEMKEQINTLRKIEEKSLKYKKNEEIKKMNKR